jgi:tRNA U34 5-carboxymethylaminomethyl modifying GTPase MnmE/TrmE
MSAIRDYEGYMALRGRLAEDIAALAREAEALGAPERAKRLQAAREALLSDAFKLMVLGEFKRGKSTLINAMLGRDVLPARVAPCTAVITEVKHGETPRALLFPREGGEAQEVPVDRLRDYITVQGDEDEEEDETPAASSPWSKLELEYPLELLRQNVMVIDSPGLNEHLTRTRLALDYLAGADAVVVVLSCQQALSASELAFIDRELAGRNLRHVFFVWNHLDAVAGDASEVAAVEKRTEEELAPRVGSSERVHYLSAREALVARKSGGEPAPAFGAFEKSLEQFLASERGRVKLLTPLRAAETVLAEAQNHVIPEREALLEQPLRELEERYARERPRLDALEARREKLLATIERRREALVKEAVASYQRFAAETSRDLPDELRTVDVSVFQALLSRSRTHARLSEHLEGWFEGRVAGWREEALNPLVDKHLRQLQNELDEQARAFWEDLSAARAALVPQLRVQSGAEADVAPADRLLSAVGGFFVGGIGAAIEGASVGFRGMSRGLIFHIGIGAGLVALGLGMPIVLPVLAAVGVGRSVWEANQGVEKMRDRVAREVGAQLSASVPEVSGALADRLTGEFDRLIAAMDAGMRLAIEEAVGQVQAMLREKREGEEKLAAERVALAEARGRLDGLARQLATIRFELESAT